MTSSDYQDVIERHREWMAHSREDLNQKESERKRFVEDFSLDKILSMGLDDYVVGKLNRESFCHRLEYSVLRGLGGAKGGASQKWGIWYSKKEAKYKCTDVLARAAGIADESDIDSVFEYLKISIVNLIKAGQTQNLDALKTFPLGPVPQGKILSTYYPETYASVFKEEMQRQYLEALGVNMTGTETGPERQLMLAEWKKSHSEFDEFSMQDFTNMLDEITTRGQKEKLSSGCNLKEEFEQWMRTAKPKRSDVGDVYSEERIKNYVGNLSRLGNLLQESDEWSVFSIDSPDDIAAMIENIKHHPKDSQNNYSSPLRRYREFLLYRNGEQVLEPVDDEDEPLLLPAKGKNIILYGPPGTGKTFNVPAMAWLISQGREANLEAARGLSDDERKQAKTWYDAQLELEDGQIAFTTFHQSYGYEEFIEGIRPVLSGEKKDDGSELRYILKPGIFKSFCEKAEKDEGKPYIFIIDEINRGNISKIFGELITLIEDTKRKGADDQQSAVLPYSGDPFSVPKNVILVGTMNTADRSIALMDTALRRRFKFFEVQPNYDVLREIDVAGINIAEMVKKINRRIEVLLDREHAIGHSYFMELQKRPAIEELASVFENRVIPLLQEYFFDDYEKIRLVLADNQKADKNIQFITECGDEEFLFGPDYDDYDTIKTFSINKKAFLNPEAYLRIYQRVDE